MSSRDSDTIPAIPTPEDSPYGRIVERIKAADKLGTTKILLDLKDVKALMEELERLRQKREYEAYVNSKPAPIIERRVDDRG